MTGIKKVCFIGLTLIASGLILGSILFAVRSRMYQSVRPRLLEADLRSRVAECRTGPGQTFFGDELKTLSSRLSDAEQCLSNADRVAWFRKDYSRCSYMLVEAIRDAKRLKLKLEQREQAQIRILDALLPSLRLVLTGNGKGQKVWTQFNLSGIEQKRARNLLEEAEVFYAQEEFDLSFHTAFRSLISWNRFSDGHDLSFARFSNAGFKRKWDQQTEKLLKWSRQTGKRAIIVDTFGHLCIVIYKGRVEKSYKADLGRNWYQRKVRAQDAATPEGDYSVTRLIARGTYGRALLINYPNKEDKARFDSLKRKGEIPASAKIGSRIEIHGSGGRDTDWTDGCVALSDKDMSEVYAHAYVGMPVTIVGISRWAMNGKD